MLWDLSSVPCMMKLYTVPWYLLPPIPLDIDGTPFSLEHHIFHPQRFHLYQGLSSGYLCIFLNVCYSDSAPPRFKVDFSSPFLLILYDLNLGVTFGGDRFIFMLQIVHRLFGSDNVLLSLPCVPHSCRPFPRACCLSLCRSLVVSAVPSYV